MRKRGGESGVGVVLVVRVENSPASSPRQRRAWAATSHVCPPAVERHPPPRFTWCALTARLAALPRRPTTSGCLPTPGVGGGARRMRAAAAALLHIRRAMAGCHLPSRDPLPLPCPWVSLSGVRVLHTPVDRRWKRDARGGGGGRPALALGSPRGGSPPRGVVPDVAATCDAGGSVRTRDQVGCATRSGVPCSEGGGLLAATAGTAGRRLRGARPCATHSSGTSGPPPTEAGGTSKDTNTRNNGLDGSALGRGWVGVERGSDVRATGNPPSQHPHPTILPDPPLLPTIATAAYKMTASRSGATTAQSSPAGSARTTPPAAR